MITISETGPEKALVMVTVGGVVSGWVGSSQVMNRMILDRRIANLW
jgi:hypothetical protein|tara:strand:+ start:337 stop:474 length:138 start_codon:yes stop_codon:yes gene_type:complete